jgi:hypothetical protein
MCPRAAQFRNRDLAEAGSRLFLRPAELPDRGFQPCIAFTRPVQSLCPETIFTSFIRHGPAHGIPAHSDGLFAERTQLSCGCRDIRSDFAGSACQNRRIRQPAKAATPRTPLSLVPHGECDVA